MCCSVLSMQKNVLAEDKVYLRPLKDQDSCSTCPNTLEGRIIACPKDHGFHRECVIQNVNFTCPKCNTIFDEHDWKVLQSVGELGQPVIVQLNPVNPKQGGDDGEQYRAFIRIDTQYTILGKILRSAANCFHWASFALLNVASMVLSFCGEFAPLVAAGTGIMTLMTTMLVITTASFSAVLILLGLGIGSALGFLVLGKVFTAASEVLAIDMPKHTPSEIWNQEYVL